MNLEGLFTSGETVFLPGASGEPAGLIEALREAPHVTRGLAVLTSFVPGINILDLAAFDPTARVEGLFMQPALQGAQHSGRFRHRPTSYAGFQRDLAAGEPIDVCLVQVAPPDAKGRCSLGPAAEFTPAIAARSRRLVGFVNPDIPALPRSPWLAIDAFERLIDTRGAPRPYDAGTLDPTSQAIAEVVSGFVEDGTVLQVGLGKTPAALLQALSDRTDLRFHSGMLSDAAFDLADAGVLDPDWDHVACVIVGTPALYSRASAYDLIRVTGCDHTHSASVLAGMDRLVAVNSALEVDLFGQCNLEIIDGRGVSGAGGAPDFARAARLSRGGLSVIALPATSRAGSRITARLSPGVVTSLPRTDIDLVVTEHGAADLRGCSVCERAERLIAVAAPEIRSDLSSQWHAIARNL